MEEQQIKILLVEDDEDDYVITRDMLSEIGGAGYLLDWTPTYNTAFEAIKQNKHDVYLFDYRLGEHSGLELLRETVKSGCKSPVIMLTGQGDHEVDIESMKSGAADYLIKGKIDASALEHSIRYAIERKKAEERILFLAYYDSLTNLPNRILFKDRLNQTLSVARRYQRLLAILFLDLDNFKRINDTLGHSVGDELLKQVADRLSNCIRKSDSVSRYSTDEFDTVVARLGGDEFTILLTEIAQLHDAMKVAQRILDAIAQPCDIEGQEVFVTASIGIAIYPIDGEDVDTLLKNCDTAMYHAKNEGRNNYKFYEQSLNKTALDSLTLENDLRKALDKQEFMVYYQPRIDIRTKNVVGFEALIRWQHPQKGMVPPLQFIPMAEENGLIVPIGEWILHVACRQNKAWQSEGFAPIFLSVNLSGKQFKQQNLIKTVEQALSETALDPKYLELEITESIIQDTKSTAEILSELRKLGLKISVDDFGTGYSSLSYLRRFPVDALKIDRSFVKDATKDTDSAAIVKAIIAMSHCLKLRVVAEGVETEEQLKFLSAEGCDEFQGYLVSPPLPAEEITKFLVKGSSQ